MANTSSGKPAGPTSLTTSPDARASVTAGEDSAAKLRRLREENDVLREELVNIELHRKVKQARGEIR
jgi:hypothetical protein